MRIVPSFFALAAFSLTLLPLAPSIATADETGEKKDKKDLPSITFSNLVYRLEKANTDFGVFNDELRILLVETLRFEGYQGVGAESLVFQRDESSKADYAIGGTLRETSCAKQGSECCAVGIDWELLDLASDQVVYRHRSRYGECHLGSLEGKAMSRRLIIGALRSVLQRDAFKRVVESRSGGKQEKPYPPAKLARCKTSKISMTKSGEAAIDAALIVESGRGHGSGFLLTPDGLIMTAAHVVTTNDITVKTRDGVAYRAHPVRISRKFDVALLQGELTSPLPAERCFSLNTEQQRAGAGLYAVGAPASEELGFSLTRGIVSALRLKDGVHYLQTDTPVSPGNSGGPLVDEKGQVVAVVVSKVVDQAMEGIGFGIPVDIALRALGLSLDAKTDDALATAPAIAIGPAQSEAAVDPADPIPQPKNNYGRNLNPSTFPGANVQRRKDIAKGVDAVQGWFYLGAGLELYMIAAPKAAKGRVSVRLMQKAGTYLLKKDCGGLQLVVNGRPYDAIKSDVEVIHSGSLERVDKLESQFHVDDLKRMREHAPTFTLRACNLDWTFAPTQLEAINELLDEYASLAGEAN